METEERHNKSKTLFFTLFTDDFQTLSFIYILCYVEWCIIKTGADKLINLRVVVNNQEN